MTLDQIAHTPDAAVSMDLGLELDLLYYTKKRPRPLNYHFQVLLLSHSDRGCCGSFSGLIIPSAVLESLELKSSVN